MANLKEKSEDLVNDVTEYVETYVRFTSLNVADKTSGFASTTLFLIILGAFTFLVLLFSGIGAGWWLGEQLNNMVAGFCIIAAFYIVIVLIGILFRKKLNTIFRDLFIKEILKEMP